jgi:hypothetical protein
MFQHGNITFAQKYGEISLGILLTGIISPRYTPMGQRYFLVLSCLKHLPFRACFVHDPAKSATGYSACNRIVSGEAQCLSIFRSEPLM